MGIKWKQDISENTQICDIGFRISVTRHIYYPKDMWLLFCYELNLEEVKLKSKELEDAKKEALKIVQTRLLERLKLDKEIFDFLYNETLE